MSLVCVLQPDQDKEQMQRPAVREEDLTEAKNKLGSYGPTKSKTYEVMEECGEHTQCGTLHQPYR